MNEDMPALSKSAKIPVKIINQLKNLDRELLEHDITTKGCYKKKWALLKQYVSNEIATNIQKIQKLIMDGEMDENIGYTNILEILKIENISINETKTSQNNHILCSTENLPSFSNNVPVPSTSKKQSKQITKKISENIITKKIENDKPKNKLSNKNKRKTNNSTSLSDKKSKTNNTQDDKIIEVALPPKSNISKSTRCDICQQEINSQTLFYKGHPLEAVDEFVALTDPKLMLFTGEENTIHNFDERPINKITHFTIYDKEGHLCPFDSGLIEKNILLHFSGYIKPVYEENSSTLNGIPAKDLGPINEWWISGFDGGQKALLGLSTAYCEYYLMDPSEEYKPLMKSIEEKMYLSKIIIEYLLNNKMQNPKYEDLLNHVQNCSLPENLSQITEDTLLKHAQFICDQVTSFDSTADDDESLLISMPCMKSLVNLVGVTFNEKQSTRHVDIYEVICNTVKRKRKAEYYKFSKATTTDLIRNVFESFFPDEIIRKDFNEQQQQKRCGTCASCQQLNCGKCSVCKSSKTKKGNIALSCLKRRCRNFTIQSTSDSENEELENTSMFPLSPTSSKQLVNTVIWSESPVHVDHTTNKTYYNSALIGDNIRIQPGDYVILNTDKLIAKIINMYEEETSLGKMFHAHMFCRGVDTILGETCDPKEIFSLGECDVCPLGSIVRKTNVQVGNNYPIRNEANTFYCHKQYNRKYARFEDILEDAKHTHLNYTECMICERKSCEESINTPVFKDGIVFWRNETFKPGTAVYLLSNTFEFKTAPVISTKAPSHDVVDETVYTEFYRKKNDVEENVVMSEPFGIGYIQEIFSDQGAIEINVQKLYRPENTHKGITLSQQLDLNVVFWSDERQIIKFEKVVGKCYLAHADILDIPIEDWTKQGPNRFYFTQMYNSKTQEFLPVDETCSYIGKQRKSKTESKVKNKNSDIEEPLCWPQLQKPLRTMDVFAGCGGLSEGLHQSGVAETKWAIEKEKAAAEAFRLNNPNSIVYNEDCNRFLSLAMSKASHTETGQPLPCPGDVELLVGGPPCQGFSGMNRFNAGQYSLFKNSLIVSYLSFCDFFRPKYFILENVRNFAVFKKGLILKLTLKCLLAMGYQCAFGILQAGNYGVPQSRRRLIVLAAAPGEVLPQFPEPLHVLDNKKRALHLDIIVDGKRYSNGLKLLQIGAPYRTITVRDAMSDLPPITNGCHVEERSYETEASSHFQRLLRGTDDQVLRDHICKEMAPIVEARMSFVPLASGSDWRDLPNIVVKLSDGSCTNKLQYNYKDRKSGGMRGVCPCAERKRCDPSERQFNTLIPWCLPHTANRHNQWVGLYGRIDWDGLFATTVTNPEPMGHQGRVVHPSQNRVVSVRECARSQGFPDKYFFHGNILDKHRQVGNAVPPPLGAAIGREILRAALQNKTHSNLSNDFF